MILNWLFFANSVAFGIGLAMDAFSVSMANGLNEPNMSKRKTLAIAGIFGGFQTLMPMIGWICVRTIVAIFSFFQSLIPWIALVLLLFVGGKMLVEGIKNKNDEELPAVGMGALILQGIATSIDALSVGFTNAEMIFFSALLEALIIGVVTYFICILGLELGKKFGIKKARVASIAGGIILIAIGFEIFITGVIGN